MNDELNKKWENFLNPETLRHNIIWASIFITGYELLKENIIENLSYFFMDGLNEKGLILGSSYKENVLKKDKNKNPLWGSIEWYKESGAINTDDILKFKNIRKIRNKLVHQLLDFTSEGIDKELIDSMNDLIYLSDKIGKWWIINIEIPTDEQWDDKEIIEDEIVPGSTMTLKLLLDIALGDKEISEYYIKEFQKHFKR